MRSSNRCPQMGRAWSALLVALTSTACSRGPRAESGPPRACDDVFLVAGGRCTNVASAQKYNRSVGFPHHLDTFLQNYCLAANSGQIELAYVNHGDLRLGRLFRITRCGLLTVALVANFGEPGQPILQGIDELAGDSAVAVAMVHDPSLGPGYETQFAVYDDGQLATGLHFDSEGFKTSPHTCTVCHGGVLEEEAGIVRGAYFLPLVSSALTFDGITVASDEALRLANEIVYDTYPAVDDRVAGFAAAEVIEALYRDSGGVKQPGAAQVDGALLEGWSDDPDPYRELIQPFCISCHQVLPNVPLNSSAATDWQRVGAAACPSLHPSKAPMPQSEVTNNDYVTNGAAHNHACQGVL